MKKSIILILVGVIVFLGMISTTEAQVKVTLYLFRGEGCQHCEAALEYLDTIKEDYPMMEVVTYEVFENNENAELCEQVKEVLNSDSKGVPFIVIGERYLTGFAEYRKEDIKAALEYYLIHYDEYQDVIMDVKSNKETSFPVTTSQEDITPIPMHQKEDKMYRNIAICSGLLVICGAVYWYISKKEKRA